MNTTIAATIVTGIVTDIGSILATNLPIIVGLFGLLIGLAVAYGYLTDNSFRMFGIYMHDVPYEGYNRFRSRNWNMQHTMK